MHFISSLDIKVGNIVKVNKHYYCDYLMTSCHFINLLEYGIIFPHSGLWMVLMGKETLNNISCGKPGIDVNFAIFAGTNSNFSAVKTSNSFLKFDESNCQLAAFS